MIYDSTVWPLENNFPFHSLDSDIPTLTLYKRYIHFIKILETKAMKLKVRRQIVSTAIMYLRRFYSRNSICQDSEMVVCATCLYLACKIEEASLHIKSIAQEFNIEPQQIADFEFKLLEQIDFHLILHHPHMYIQGLLLEAQQQQQVHLQLCFGIANDLYKTKTAILLYSPLLLATSAVFFAFSLRKVETKQWLLDRKDVELECIPLIIQDLLDFYSLEDEHEL